MSRTTAENDSPVCAASRFKVGCMTLGKCGVQPLPLSVEAFQNRHAFGHASDEVNR